MFKLDEWKHEISGSSENDDRFNPRKGCSNATVRAVPDARVHFDVNIDASFIMRERTLELLLHFQGNLTLMSLRTLYHFGTPL